MNFFSIPIQMAQQLYEESEDHLAQMKAESSNESVVALSKVADKLIGLDIDAIDDKELDLILQEMKNNVKNTNSNYLKKTFPEIFA